MRLFVTRRSISLPLLKILKWRLSRGTTGQQIRSSVLYQVIVHLIEVDGAPYQNASVIDRVTPFSGDTEDCTRSVDRQQRHVLVVDDELWIFESIVDAKELLQTVGLHLAEVLLHDDVENLSGSLVVPRVDGIPQLTGGTVQFPVDTLYGDEQQSDQPEQEDCGRALEEERPPDRHL